MHVHCELEHLQRERREEKEEKEEWKKSKEEAICCTNYTYQRNRFESTDLYWCASRWPVCFNLQGGARPLNMMWKVSVESKDG